MPLSLTKDELFALMMTARHEEKCAYEDFVATKDSQLLRGNPTFWAEQIGKKEKVWFLWYDIMNKLDSAYANEL